MTDVDRLPWKSQSEFWVVRAKHKFKSLWALSVVPHFSLSPPRLVVLALGNSNARPRFASFTFPVEKWGLPVVTV